MFILVYGTDGVGKSVQVKSVLESHVGKTIHWSFATKNRKLYENSSVKSKELLQFNEDITINPYKTMDVYADNVSSVIKAKQEPDEQTILAIDEITYLRTWAQPLAVEEYNRAHENKIKLCGKNDLAWQIVNRIVNKSLERLANWAEINNAIVIAICALSDEYTLIQNSEGKSEKSKTGRMLCSAHKDIQKLADVKILLEKDGKSGKGYHAVFEKCQGWMLPGKDSVKVDKDGLMMELTARGVL